METISYARFEVRRTELKKTLKQLDIHVANRKKRLRTICEMTIIKGYASFNVPGVTLAIEVESTGSAKATFELTDFIGIIKMFSERKLFIRIQKNRVFVNTFSFSATTTFFEDDKILRSIILPVNYSDIDLVSISASNKYTDEELKFNKLFVPVNQANQRMNNRISAAKRELIFYGITKADIEAMVTEKIKLHISVDSKSLNVQKEIQDKK